MLAFSQEGKVGFTLQYREVRLHRSKVTRVVILTVGSRKIPELSAKREKRRKKCAETKKKNKVHHSMFGGKHSDT